MVAYLEMTTKDVTLFSMFYTTDYQYHLWFICQSTALINTLPLNNFILCECHIDVRYYYQI
jgi:hypothetical protein